VEHGALSVVLVGLDSAAGLDGKYHLHIKIQEKALSTYMSTIQNFAEYVSTISNA
jgi:hypothetical protein